MYENDELNVGCALVFPGRVNEVLAFLWDFHNIERFIEHVISIRNLDEPVCSAQRQILEMKMRTEAGAVLLVVTERKRLHNLIAYQMHKMPAFLKTHVGEWVLCHDEQTDGTLVFFNHRIRIATDVAMALFKAKGRNEMEATVISLVRKSGTHALLALKNGFVALRHIDILDANADAKACK